MITVKGYRLLDQIHGEEKIIPSSSMVKAQRPLDLTILVYLENQFDLV